MKHEHRPAYFNFKRFSFKNFILASILFHITLFGLLFLTTQIDTSRDKSEVVEISFVDPQIEKQLIVNPTLIAETDSARANDELSEKAKFLSEKNNTVKKETRAKSGNKFHNAEKPAVAQKQIQKQMTAKTKSEMTKPQLFENSFDAYASMTKKEMLMQKAQSQSRAEDSSTTNDNLAKIESDLMTRLNTKEYRYYGYYNRIKNQLNQWWVPKVQQKFTKMMKQGRTIASEENKVTKLVIILNNAGRLVNVQVLAESGVKDLDDAAIEAFRSAAPFPNPPKGMIDDDGTVKIRWDCVVES